MPETPGSFAVREPERSGEFQPAVLFLNDHREEAMLFQIGPQLRRQIGHFVGDGEVVRHPAGFFHRAVDKACSSAVRRGCG
jgi:hypothetical protein